MGGMRVRSNEPLEGFATKLVEETKNKSKTQGASKYPVSSTEHPSLHPTIHRADQRFYTSHYRCKNPETKYNQTTMNAELLAMLGGGAPPAAARREEANSILSFKAGKMMAELQPVSYMSLVNSQRLKVGKRESYMVCVF